MWRIVRRNSDSIEWGASAGGSRSMICAGAGAEVGVGEKAREDASPAFAPRADIASGEGSIGSLGELHRWHSGDACR